MFLFISNAYEIIGSLMENKYEKCLRSKINERMTLSANNTRPGNFVLVKLWSFQQGWPEYHQKLCYFNRCIFKLLYWTKSSIDLTYQLVYQGTVLRSFRSMKTHEFVTVKLFQSHKRNIPALNKSTTTTITVVGRMMDINDDDQPHYKMWQIGISIKITQM